MKALKGAICIRLASCFMSKGIYKSPESYKILMAFYEAHLQRWPAPLFLLYIYV
jgi:hypothetical protein